MFLFLEQIFFQNAKCTYGKLVKELKNSRDDYSKNELNQEGICITVLEEQGEGS